MFDLSDLYYPITAHPAEANEYTPSKALRPYIRCFWGDSSREERLLLQAVHEDQSVTGPAAKEVIIPDTCMDIIVEWDESSGESRGVFCGINDAPFEVGQVPGPANKNYFAIRFHFWAVHLFADDHLREVLNIHSDVEHYFTSFRSELGEKLIGTRTIAERIIAAEAYLLRRLEGKRWGHDGMMNAVYTLLKCKGVTAADALESSTGLSSRQLQRLFHEYIGIPPKKVADLIRFQNVWQELYDPSYSHHSFQDVVYSFGFSHQSHMINNFKKYAGRTPLEALKAAKR